MSLLYRYIVREISRYFGIVLVLVIGVYLAVDFIEKIDDFIEAGVPFARAFYYFLYKTPLIVAQITPVGILLATLIVFGLMSRHNEIVALKSSGVGIHYLLKPAVSVGLLASVALFGLSEIVVPLTMDKANRIWLQEVKKEKVVASREKNIWIKGERSVTNIAYFNPVEKSIAGVALYWFDDQFRLVRRVDARRGRFREGSWVLEDAMEQTLDSASGNYAVQFHARLQATLGFVPADLQRGAAKPEEMSIFELRRYIRKVAAEGYDATALRVDFFGKLALPLVCLIMSLVGTGIAARGRIDDGLPVSIAYGLGLVFLYWVLYSFCMSLGYGGMLPAVLAAGIANFVFLSFGLLTLLNAE